MDKNFAKKTVLSKIFLIAAVLEGGITLTALLGTQSMKRNAFLLGFSAPRLALGGLTFFLTATLAFQAYQSLKQPDWLIARINQLDSWLVEQDHLLLSGFSCIFLGLIFGGLAILSSAGTAQILGKILISISPIAPQILSDFSTMMSRSLPLLIWLAILSGQTLLLSIMLYPQQFLQKVRDGSIYRVFLGIGVIAAAVFQWTVLYFHLKTFLVIRGWKWYFHDKPWPIGIWPFVLVFVLAIAIVIFILKNPQRYKISVILLILLGYAIQVSFGFLEGAGFESIRVKYAGSVFDEYSWVAARDTDLGHSLLNFEQLYGYGGYLGTKPPGVYLVYELTQKAANLFYSNIDVASSFIGSTTFSAYVFPLISFLVLIPLYFLSRFDRSQPDSVLPGILYVAIPSVVLIPLFLDEVLYPLIFVAFLLLSGFLVKKQSIALAFLAGFLINGIVYFSFSLLPVAPLVFLWLAIDYLIQRQKWKFNHLLKIMLALLAGILVGFLVFRFGLNYDPILRYSKAFAEHRQIKDFQDGLGQIYYASVLNNAEFASWTGLPIILLFLSSFVNCIRKVITKKSTELDSLLLSFVITYAALNIFGQTIGEVQRLWIFMMPMVCLYAVQETRRLFNRKDIGIPLLLALQLITVLLTFTFQDFYGG